MYDHFRDATGQNDLRVYAHNVCDVPLRGSVAKRAPRIHPMRSASIVMVLQPAECVAFRAEQFGHLLLNEHVVQDSGLVQLAWPVAVHEPGEIAPITEEMVEWVLARKTSIDPGEAVLITTCRS